VSVLTLVMHTRDDARVPFDQGRRRAAGIPGARFVSLASRNHLILEDEPDFPRFVEEIRSFLAAQASTYQRSQPQNDVKILHDSSPGSARRGGRTVSSRHDRSPTRQRWIGLSSPSDVGLWHRAAPSGGTLQGQVLG
jgi:hypothetical protein